MREEVFEQALVESGAAPSASGIIARHDAVTRPPVAAMDSHKALWLGGRLFDFDREGALDEDPNELLASSPSVAIIVTHKLANPKLNSHNTSSLINTSGQMALNTWPSDMHWIIIRAIIERRLLGIYYEPGARIVEPCAYGLSREQHGLLRAFQTSGASASGKHVNWKLLLTDRITQMHVLAERFDRPRPEYRRDDKVMVGGIYCQL